ncbi:MAG: 50S ribosomal protein L29 [Chromatiales bacterium]|jgi:large subunit ribosomal protein L29|nr:50S ribosomal protein L29 [Chromatiales bacterium]MDP6151547.1 50S ribosomal protein L29 [Gammaproteobacteria bacterium]MDP7092929.1 50S ribosomal protein L29 [Gammaproteobacteria bacterium]MDP7271435.1 50S ribosomal protein L29 [Gammaproteobacteria bacterium]HJP05717.1 50S ribosomal protein L29 [Gammaproteobacteria bacterium]
MKASELKDKSRDELLEELVGLRREQFNLRMQQAIGQMARPDQYRKVRKNIARVKTVLRAQDIAAAKQESAS